MTRGARTEWHLAELSSIEADPFATAAYSAGITIDLTSPEPMLFDVLKALLDREGRLYVDGVRCDLKDAGQDCRTCTASSHDPGDGLALLCAVGKDEMAVAERAGALATHRLAPMREIAEIADEFSELGHLDPALVDWLTGIGL